MSRIIQFNVAQLAVTPYLDISGNIITNPTSIVLDGIQGFDLTLKGTIKQLMADKQFAIAGARGESSVDGKIKAVRNSAEIISSLYTGQGYGTATFTGMTANQVVTKTTTSTAVTTFVIGPAGADFATGTGNNVISDLGIVDTNGNSLPRVSGTPTVDGTYSVAISSGVATYSIYTTVGVTNAQYYFSFTSLTATPPTGTVNRSISLTNQMGGATPVLILTAATSFQGRKCTLIFPWTISSNLNLLSLKNLEFSGFEIDFSCFPDQTVAQTIMTGFFLE